MKQALLLYNPAAGRFSPSSRRLARLVEKLAVLGVAATLRSTNQQQVLDSSELSGKDFLVLYGGDGTIHEALPALLESSARLAVLPAGTGNVLAKELGIPLHPERALQLLAGGKTTSIRIGQAQSAPGKTRFFHLMAGIGLDAYVIAHTTPRLKRVLGWASYWWSGLRSFWKIPLTPFRVKLDDVAYEATFAVVSNCRTYGGQLLMAPHADLSDAVLDVCLFTTTRRWRLPAYLAAALAGSHIGMNDVIYRKATRVLIEGSPEIPVQMDGDVKEQLPVAFSLCDRAIEVVVP